MDPSTEVPKTILNYSSNFYFNEILEKLGKLTHNRGKIFVAKKRISIYMEALSVCQTS